MNICEDSSEGITFDLENIHGNVHTDDSRLGETPPTLVNSNEETSNNLVLYFVVNQNEVANLSESSNAQEINEMQGVLPRSQDVQGFDIEPLTNESENVGIADSTPSCSLDDDLNSANSSQHLISSFGTENVLELVSEDNTSSGDGVLTDHLNVNDPLTTQLLQQPGLSEVESNIDMAEIKDDAENDEENPISLDSDSVIDSKPPETVPLPQGLVHQVNIGGQQFLLITGPPVQESASVAELTGETGAPALGTLVTTNTAGLPTSFVNGDEPPTKRILVTTTPVVPETISVQQPKETSLSSTHFSREELQELNVIEFTDQVESVACVTSECAAEQNVETLLKIDKAEETDVSQTWFTTKDDKVALQNTGKTWKQGQWSKDEVEVLQQNIAIYCKEHNISDPTEVIFVMTKEERKNFYRTISRGLNRPLFSVYRRVIRMYDSTNHIGKYSPEELEKLKQLRMKYGTDWAAIGTAMGRSPSSVKDRCRLMKDQCNSGKWLPEEERRLTEAVQRLTGMVPGESVTSGLSWAVVAEQVGTRSEKQCRTKWLNYLNWKQRGGTEWNRADDLALIDKVYNLCVTEENQIDWSSLAANWPSARSPQWLRGKWWSLKRHVPDYQLLSFPELIDRLKTNHRAIVRSMASNDNYAVKLPINLNINVPGGSTMVGDNVSNQYHDSSSDVSAHTGSDSNTDPNLLPTLTQEQMVEMQPGRVSGTLKLVYHQQPGAKSESPISLINEPLQSSSESSTHHFLNKIEKTPSGSSSGTEVATGTNFGPVGVLVDPVTLAGTLESRELQSVVEENGLEDHIEETDETQHLPIKIEPTNILLNSNLCQE